MIAMFDPREPSDPGNSWPWHAGERAAHHLAGFATSSGGAIRTELPDQHRAFFAQLPFVVVASVDPHPVATIWSGAPGFVRSPDRRSLTVAADLDPADPATAAFTPGAPFGLLGIELSTRRRNRANGTVTAVAPGRIALAVHQSFGNCPQYIHPRTLREVPAAPVSTIPLAALDAAARDALARADTCFVASAARLAEPTGGVDVSHRGGPRGFVRVAGDTLIIPDYPGNRYFNTLGNLLADPRAALLVPDFTTGDLLHLQGTAEIAWHEAELPGAERTWRLHVHRAWRRPGALPLRA